VKTIHHVVDIDASVTTVWHALTDEQQLAGWWSSRVDAPSARVGAMVQFAGDFNPSMEITVLSPERELTWRCQSGHDPWRDNTFRFEIADADGAPTRLRFWQDYAVELADDAYGVYNFNWGYYLESLRLLCTTGRGRPFPVSGRSSSDSPIHLDQTVLMT
jgi:uncharacterized protein YndB with AHSA1/START domain